MAVEERIVDPHRPMNVLDALCPSRDVFVDLADKWVLLMLVSLRELGVQRCSEPQRSLGGISRKMRSQTLWGPVPPDRVGAAGHGARSGRAVAARAR
ncbi:winged helix-turn-helix transcriptional regulator, partial [Streptomyces sp. NPDC005122]